MTRVRTVLCAAAALIAFAAPASRAAAQPDDELKLSLGYDGKLLFLKVLDVQLNERANGAAHDSSAQIQSSGILAAFKKFDIKATESGRIAHGDPQPGVFRHENHDGKNNRKVEVVWTPQEVTTSATPQLTFLGDPPATREQKLASVGYLTAVMRLTIAADEGPCRGAEMIFNGKELSELGFSDPRPEMLNETQKKLGLTHGLRCNAAFREVAGYKKKKGKARNQGLSRPIFVDFARIGQTGPWVAAKLQTDTPLGAAVIELARIHLEGRLPQALVQSAER